MKKQIRLEEESFKFLKVDEFINKSPANENLKEDEMKKPCKNNEDVSNKNYREDQD